MKVRAIYKTINKDTIKNAITVAGISYLFEMQFDI